MTTLREAAQQTLEVLESGLLVSHSSQVVTALRAALAQQAEPVEPVAWRVQRSDGQYELYFVKASAERAAECYIKRPQVEPLYTASPQRKPLTEEEIERIARDCLDAWSCTRAVERAHGIKE